MSMRALLRQMVLDDEQRCLAALSQKPIPEGFDGLSVRTFIPLAGEIAAEMGILPPSSVPTDVVVSALWVRPALAAAWALRSRALLGPPDEYGSQPTLGSVDLEAAI